MATDREQPECLLPLPPATFHILLALADDERRRYYRLTPFGTAVARAEMRRLAQLVRLARARGLTPGPEPA